MLNQIIPRSCAIILLILLLPSVTFSQNHAELQVEKGFRLTTLRGYSRAIDSATISAQVSGRITAINYDVGDTVATKPLLQIDPTLIDLDLQTNTIELASNKITQQQAQIKYDWLQKEYQRQSTLIQQRRISQVAFDEISQKRDQAQLALQQQQQLQLHLQVQRQVLLEQQRRHQPHAITGWLISERYVENGELVQVGSKLFDVENYSQLLVPLAVSAVELQQLRRQQLHQRHIATLADVAVHYKIHTVSPAFDETTRKIKIELEILDYAGEKRGGLPLRITIKLPDSGLMIPAAAVSNRYQHPQVQPTATTKPVAITIIDNVQTANGNWVHIAPNQLLPAGTALTNMKAQ